MWPGLTKTGFHAHNGKANTTWFLHQWTNDPCVYHCQWFPRLIFLGLVSWACLTCLSTQVVFKWQWYDWTSTHPAGNHHMTGQKAWPSNWLLLYLWYLEFKWASGPSGSVQLLCEENPATSWLSTTPPPLCDHLWY